MGIPSWVEKAKIEIKKESLVELRKDLSEYLSHIHTKPSAHSLDDMVSTFGFVFKYNRNGDVVGIKEECEKTYYEEDFMDLIAPHIKSGSFIQLGVSGEAGNTGDVTLQWSFVNGKVIAENSSTKADPQFYNDNKENKLDFPTNIKITDWSAIYQKKYLKINTEQFIEEMNKKKWGILLYKGRYKPYQRDALEWVKIAGIKKPEFSQQKIDKLIKEGKINKDIISSIDGHITLSVSKNFHYPSWIFQETETEWEDEKATLPPDIGEFLENTKIQFEISSINRGRSNQLHKNAMQVIYKMVSGCLFTTDGKNYFKNF